MALVKMIGEDYPDKKDLQNLVHYMIQPDKAVHGLVGGFSLLPTGEEAIIRQMETVKEVWHKQREGRQGILWFPLPGGNVYQRPRHGGWPTGLPSIMLTATRLYMRYMRIQKMCISILYSIR